MFNRPIEGGIFVDTESSPQKPLYELDVTRRKRLRDEVVAGCREMAEIYVETEREFHPLEEEIAERLPDD